MYLQRTFLYTHSSRTFGSPILQTAAAGVSASEFLAFLLKHNSLHSDYRCFKATVRPYQSCMQTIVEKSPISRGSPALAYPSELVANKKRGVSAVGSCAWQKEKRPRRTPPQMLLL
jgi:hypothetical protein